MAKPIPEVAEELDAAVLNVAGSRESGDAGIHAAALEVLRRAFTTP